MLTSTRSSAVPGRSHRAGGRREAPRPRTALGYAPRPGKVPGRRGLPVGTSSQECKPGDCRMGGPCGPFLGGNGSSR